MTAQDLLDKLSVKIYSPPLSEIRSSGAIADVSNPVHVAMLLIDFETEVSMSGIVDFIGNSTGLYLAETVEALKLLGRSEDATLLSKIDHVARVAGMTHEAIQADRSSLPVYSVTSFSELHGGKWIEASREIAAYGSTIDFSGIMQSVLGLVQANTEVFENALADDSRV